MRIGILSDAHANHSALESCVAALQKREGVERFVFLGDAVGYLSEPNEVIELLRQIEATCLMGNHDAMVLGRLPSSPRLEQSARVSETRSMLTAENRDFLESLEPSWSTRLDGLRVLFVHGGPGDELQRYVYPDSDLSDFESTAYDLICMGHTHRPFIRPFGNPTVEDRSPGDRLPEVRLAVNVGSCGLPRDHGGLASAAIYDSDTRGIEIVRTRIDTRDATRRNLGKAAPEILAVFERRTTDWVGRMVSDE